MKINVLKFFPGVLALLVITHNTAKAEIKPPDWREYCPAKYLNAQYKQTNYSQTKTLLLALTIVGYPWAVTAKLKHDNQLKKNYWAMRRQSFESQVHNCTALQTVAEQVQCFNQVRQLELAQNIAREQAALQQKMVTAEETAILLNQMRNSKPKQQSVDCKSNNMGSFTSTQCRLY